MFIPAIAQFALFYRPFVLPLTYNPIAHSLIHGRLRAPTAMISPGAVCNLYCMFLWQRGERLARGRVVLAIFPRGKCGTKGKEKRKLCLGTSAAENLEDGWKVGWPDICSPCYTVPRQQFSTLWATWSSLKMLG